MDNSAKCQHELGIVKSLFASGPFKYRCNKCDAVVCRQHPKAMIPYQILFIDRVGVVFFTTVLLVFPYLPIAVSGFIILSVILYLTDVKTEPLKQCTLEQQVEENQKSLKIMVFFLIVLFLSVATYLWQD